jgi:hypothetical protein
MKILYASAIAEIHARLDDLERELLVDGSDAAFHANQLRTNVTALAAALSSEDGLVKQIKNATEVRAAARATPQE